MNKVSGEFSKKKEFKKLKHIVKNRLRCSILEKGEEASVEGLRSSSKNQGHKEMRHKGSEQRILSLTLPKIKQSLKDTKKVTVDLSK